jgi:hypothetical protein
MLNQKRPDSINPKQIDGKEDNRNQSNYRGVLYFVGRGPGNAPHFRASVAYELRSTLDKSRPRAGQSALTPGASAFRTLTKCARTRGRRANGLNYGSIARRYRLAQSAKVFFFVFFSRHFFSRSANFLYTNLAGVPGFEPGLSVLETDVLTVDTIPLGTIADFRLPI